ncbi:MAG TPA: zinc-ribbon domain-containing protein [Thermoguttaceae bacterium]|nr:zinc-ribbon domain-containing protein [Thermoguttaceae bacterium]
MSPQFGMPGFLEILVVLAVGLVCLGVPIAILIAVFAVARRSGRSTPDSPPCPSCGTYVVPGARFCHQCGSSLQERQGP